MKSRFRNAVVATVSAITLLSVWVNTSAIAAPPWMDFVRFQRIDADPDKAYGLIQDNGPWMIMSATFRGPNAQRDAQQLVYELRKNHKLPAYTHAKVYDYSEGFSGRGVDEFGEPKRMQHQISDKITEVAVLVGDYPTVDDARAQRDLKRIKSLQPTSLAGDGATTSQTFSQLRQMHRRLLKKADEKENLGPMRLAFVTTNPMLPEEYFRPQGVDKFVQDLNRGIQYSLLECSGRFTVRVGTFNGFVTSNPANIRDVEENNWKTSRLEEGALRAHRLAVALRAKGYEAYEFHNRNSSIVTVGSFNQAPTSTASGKVVYQPQVQELIYRFGAKTKATTLPTGGHPGVKPGIMPEKLLGIPFDVHPTVIEVPRRSLSTDFANRKLSVR